MRKLVWLCPLLVAIACRSGAPPGASAPPAPSVPAPPSLQALLDSSLRQRAEPAAAVVLAVRDGRVLGLAGQRGADPVRLAFRPGSTVKPLVAGIATSQQMLSPGESVECTREYAPLAGFSCFDAHGALALPDAIAVSCNSYFFDLGRRLGVSRVRAGLAAFGFGKPTGLAAGEAPGMLPAEPADDSPAAALLATGHGPFEATLLQLAAAYVKLAQRLSPPRSDVDAEIAEGLTRAVNAPSGTGRLARVEGLAVAGKTGTAEAARHGETGPRADAENGWFVGYAPAHAPEIVVAVVTLQSESGGKSAAPIAGQIFRGYFQSAGLGPGQK